MLHILLWGKYRVLSTQLGLTGTTLANVVAAVDIVFVCVGLGILCCQEEEFK